MASQKFQFRFLPIEVHLCDSDSDLTELVTDPDNIALAIADNSGATTYNLKFPTGGWTAITAIPAAAEPET